MSPKYSVFGVGNALVDILAMVDDDFVSNLGLTKGSMTLVDAAQQAEILQALEHQNLQLASGGSAANTMVAIAQSGGTGYYAGKVANDPNGVFYGKDLGESGVDFDVPPAPEEGLPTGTCIVLTTPDAERTMCTHLGVSTSLRSSDINPERIQRSQISYIEGYLWDAEDPRAACVEAMERSKTLGVKVAFTFSDSFLVDRFPQDFQDVTAKYCDILFCNADEARRFCEADDLEACAKKLSANTPLVFITDSERGCHVVQDGQSTLVPGFEVKAVDTVGAGDAFAGGALYGLTHGKTPTEAARWGNFFASEVVKIVGPRLDAVPSMPS